MAKYEKYAQTDHYRKKPEPNNGCLTTIGIGVAIVLLAGMCSNNKADITDYNTDTEPEAKIENIDSLTQKAPANAANYKLAL